MLSRSSKTSVFPSPPPKRLFRANSFNFQPVIHFVCRSKHPSNPSIHPSFDIQSSVIHSIPNPIQCNPIPKHIPPQIQCSHHHINLATKIKGGNHESPVNWIRMMVCRWCSCSWRVVRLIHKSGLKKNNNAQKHISRTKGAGKGRGRRW